MTRELNRLNSGRHDYLQQRMGLPGMDAPGMDAPGMDGNVYGPVPYSK